MCSLREVGVCRIGLWRRCGARRREKGVRRGIRRPLKKQKSGPYLGEAELQHATPNFTPRFVSLAIFFTLISFLVFPWLAFDCFQQHKKLYRMYIPFSTSHIRSLPFFAFLPLSLKQKYISF